MGAEIFSAMDPFGFSGPVNASIEQSKEARRQAGIIEGDVIDQANEFRKQTKSFRKTQELGFLKSGLTLEGTPLEIIQKGQDEAHTDFKKILERGFRQSSSVRRMGRQALTSGLNQGIGNAINSGKQMFMQAMSGGMIGSFGNSGSSQGPSIAMNYQRQSGNIA